MLGNRPFGAKPLASGWLRLFIRRINWTLEERSSNTFVLTGRTSNMLLLDNDGANTLDLDDASNKLDITT